MDLCRVGDQAEGTVPLGERLQASYAAPLILLAQNRQAQRQQPGADA